MLIERKSIVCRMIQRIFWNRVEQYRKTSITIVSLLTPQFIIVIHSKLLFICFTCCWQLCQFLFSFHRFPICIFAHLFHSRSLHYPSCLLPPSAISIKTNKFETEIGTCICLLSNRLDRTRSCWSCVDGELIVYICCRRGQKKQQQTHKCRQHHYRFNLCFEMVVFIEQVCLCLLMNIWWEKMKRASKQHGKKHTTTNSGAHTKQ